MKKSPNSGPSTRKSVAAVQAVPAVHLGLRSGHSVRKVVTAHAVPVVHRASKKGESK